jgi:hypothetical protein
MQVLPVKRRLLQRRSQNKNVFGIHKIRITSRSNGFSRNRILQRKSETSIQAKNSELKNAHGYDRAISYGITNMQM